MRVQTAGIPHLQSLIFWGVMLVLLVLVTACQRQTVIPASLQDHVDRELSYREVMQDPNAHRGKLMLAGGRVLSVDRVEDGVAIDVQQFPLSTDLVPEERRAPSLGRFVAMDQEGTHIIDPAVFHDDWLVTVVGEVLGTTTVRIGEAEEPVPKLVVKHLTVWDRELLRPYYGYRPPFMFGLARYYGRSLY